MMAITKIPEFSFKHVDQPDRPTATAAEIKTNFDSRAKNIRDTFNDTNVIELTEGAYNYAASTVGTDAYAVTITYFAAYTAGATVRFKADVANTGACTLNVNSLGAKALKLENGSDPTDGVIKAGAIVMVVYDGTNFQIVTTGLAAHTANTTTAHGATSAATANTIILRDAAGRAKVAAPSASDDIARKDTVDAVQTNLTTHANLTNPHGATVAATADRIILRDAAGRAQVAAPSAAADIARKDTVDAVQTNLTTHAALNAHRYTRSFMLMGG